MQGVADVAALLATFVPHAQMAIVLLQFYPTANVALINW